MGTQRGRLSQKIYSGKNFTNTHHTAQNFTHKNQTKLKRLKERYIYKAAHIKKMLRQTKHPAANAN